MNNTERRTGNQGGAYIGGRWVSADELRAAGRRVTDGLGRSHVGVCPACGGSRLGATDGPGTLQFAEGSECFHCGHVAVQDIRQNVEMADRSDPELHSPIPSSVDVRNGEADEPRDDEEPDSS